MSSDKALDSCKGKGINWNPNLTKCTGIGKSLLYWMTFKLELVHLFHRFYFKKAEHIILFFYQGGVRYVTRIV